MLNKTGGVLLTSHIGSEIAHVDEFFEQPVSLVFILFQLEEFEGYQRSAGFESIETTAREPYAPEVEHQSMRAFLFAR